MQRWLTKVRGVLAESRAKGPVRSITLITYLDRSCKPKILLQQHWTRPETMSLRKTSCESRLAHDSSVTSRPVPPRGPQLRPGTTSIPVFIPMHGRCNIDSDASLPASYVIDYLPQRHIRSKSKEVHEPSLSPSLSPSPHSIAHVTA